MPTSCRLPSGVLVASSAGAFVDTTPLRILCHKQCACPAATSWMLLKVGPSAAPAPAAAPKLHSQPLRLASQRLWPARSAAAATTTTQAPEGQKLPRLLLDGLLDVHRLGDHPLRTHAVAQHDGTAFSLAQAAGSPQTHSVHQQSSQPSTWQQHDVVQQIQHASACTGPRTAQPRSLTALIRRAGDITELVLLLGGHAKQLDSIHISAAVKQACRVLGLRLQPPGSSSCQQQVRQSLQQEAVLLWLRQLQVQDVQVRLQQLHSLAEPHQQEQQQQQGMAWVVQQQLAPHHLVQQQLQQAAATAVCRQLQEGQEESPGPLPSDDWLLLQQLSQLVQQHAGSMASQQLCTCLNGLTYLLLQNPQLPLLAVQPYFTALQQLLQAAQQQLREFEPQALALVLHSAAAIARAPYGMGPSNRFMKKWFCYSKARIDDFTPLDLSMSAWSLGRLQVYPPSQWMAAWWSHSKAAIPHMGAQELLMMLVGTAYIEPTPRLNTTAAAARLGWLPAVAAQLQLHFKKLTPKQLSAVMLAFARLKYQPGTAWELEYQQAWEASQAQFSAAGHSVVLWGVGSMPHSAQQNEFRVAWAKKLQHALQAAVNRAASTVAAVALLKLRQAKQQQQQQLQATQTEAADTVQQVLLHQTPQQQQDRQQDQSSSDAADEPVPQVRAQPEQPLLLSSASLLHPADCTMAISAIARLGPAAADPEFASFWLRQSRSQLGNMNSEELSVCLQSLGKLRLTPPEDWLQQAMACCGQQAACLNHQQLVMVLWGCARLQYLPTVLVTAELLMSVAAQLPSFTTHSLALLVWSLGALRLKPNKQYLRLLLRQARYRFRRFDGQDLYCVIVGLYHLRYNPGETWLAAYTKIVASKVHIISPGNYRRIIAVLRAMGQTCQGRPYAWIMDEAAVAALCNWRQSARQQEGY